MAYGDSVGFINALLTHQTNRQMVLEAGITPHLHELYWYGSMVEKRYHDETFVINAVNALSKYHLLNAKYKIAQVRAAADMDILERRALLTEAHAALMTAEDLINGAG